MSRGEYCGLTKSTGRDQIQILGLGVIAQNHLAQQGIRLFEDLARTDPHNYSLRFLGDKLEGWVNFARRVVADEVIREINVGDSIMVQCAKTYDVELTLQAVKARLGFYEYYVESSKRVLPNLYEFIFTVNQQHRQYALGSWLEYKQTARMLKENLQKGVRKESPLKEEIKEIPYTDILAIFAPEVLDISQVPLIKEVLVHLLFADRLNALVVATPSVCAKTLLRNAVERYVSELHTHHCGSQDSRIDFAETLSGIGEGILALEGVDSMTADEKTVLYDIMSTQRVRMRFQGGLYNYDAKINVYGRLDPSDQVGRVKRRSKPYLTAEERFLGYCHCIVVAKPYSAAEFEELTRFLPNARSPADEDVKKLRRYVKRARLIQPVHDGPPEEVYEFIKKVYRQREKLWIPVTPEIEKGIIELSKAHSRLRLSTRVTRDDFLHAMRLMESCLETVGLRSGGVK
jgi:hypothetical protein